LPWTTGGSSLLSTRPWSSSLWTLFVSGRLRRCAGSRRTASARACGLCFSACALMKLTARRSLRHHCSGTRIPAPSRHALTLIIIRFTAHACLSLSVLRTRRRLTYAPRSCPCIFGRANLRRCGLQVDVKRSLGAFTRGMREQAVDLRRGVLERVLNGVIVMCNEEKRGEISASREDDAPHPQLYFYYQGLHDVAAVLTLVCGERVAYGMLKRLVMYNLRDCTMCVLHDPRKF